MNTIKFILIDVVNKIIIIVCVSLKYKKLSWGMLYVVIALLQFSRTDVRSGTFVWRKLNSKFSAYHQNPLTSFTWAYACKTKRWVGLWVGELRVTGVAQIRLINWKPVILGENIAAERSQQYRVSGRKFFNLFGLFFFE